MGESPRRVEDFLDHEEDRKQLRLRSSDLKANIVSQPQYYPDYLHLDELLNCQKMRSEEFGVTAHDEHLFIVIHQVYELWFKQILFELDSVLTVFQSDYIPERHISTAVNKLHRITEIQKILLQQLTVLETMSPLSFLDFRDLLFPASGFQSVQFRKIENKLGLVNENRLNFGKKSYCSYLSSAHAEEVKKTEETDSLFQLIEKWLERTPFLDFEDFDFWGKYRQAILEMFEEERNSIMNSTTTSQSVKETQIQELEKNINHYMSLFNEEEHNRLVEQNERRLSYRATKAALLIILYQDEPVFYTPFRLISLCLDIDELLTSWRYRHAMMVHRMLGIKIGTGGSSGYHYLRSAAGKHKIFVDFFNLSTFIIPRYALPVIPSHLKSKFGFSIENEAPVKDKGNGRTKS